MATQRIRAVISFDIDGTLLDEHDRLHSADAALIARHDPEILFIPNSGRPFHSVKELLRRFHIFADQTFPLPSVNLNGSAIYGPDEKLVDMAVFDPKTQSQIIEMAFSLDNSISILLQDAYYDYVLRANAFGEQKFARYLFKIRSFQSTHRQLSFGKAMFISENPQALLPIQEICNGWAVDISSSMTNIMELVPEGVNKGSGIQRLLTSLGLEGLPVFAAGDGGNDIDFLATAERSYSPATSPTEIQELADVIIDTSVEGLLTPILRQL